MYENIYRLKTVVQTKLKTNKICNLTDLGKDLRSFLLSSNKIFAVYMTFKQFHKAEEKSNSVFQTKNFDPFKIMVIVFVIVFIFIFSKGIEVLTSPNPNSYSIPYDGPSKSVFEKWLPFSKVK